MEAILLMGPLKPRYERGQPNQMNLLHVHDVLYLFPPITNAEFPFLKLLGHFLLFVRVLGGEVLHVFHKALYVS